MFIKTNYHTHCTFCDGKNTAEEMAQRGAELGLGVLGFSSHTAWPFGTKWHLQPRQYDTYLAEISRLKELYKGKMEILAGFEAEYIRGFALPEKSAYKEFKPDYLIGSVHYIFSENLKGAEVPPYFTVDGSTEELLGGIKSHFGGDAKKAVQTYFAFERDMVQSCDFDIIGHADLIRKRNGELRFFDENDDWYRRELQETAKAIGKSGKVAEINTGGMSRAGLPSPYPSPYFLSLLKKYDIPLTLNSDSHEVRTLTDFFDAGIKAARDAGYDELWYLSAGSWKSQKIPL